MIHDGNDYDYDYDDDDVSDDDDDDGDDEAISCSLYIALFFLWMSCRSLATTEFEATDLVVRDSEHAVSFSLVQL